MLTGIQSFNRAYQQPSCHPGDNRITEWVRSEGPQWVISSNLPAQEEPSSSTWHRWNIERGRKRQNTQAQQYKAVEGRHILKTQPFPFLLAVISWLLTCWFTTGLLSRSSSSTRLTSSAARSQRAGGHGPPQHPHEHTHPPSLTALAQRLGRSEDTTRRRSKPGARM